MTDMMKSDRSIIENVKNPIGIFVLTFCIINGRFSMYTFVQSYIIRTNCIPYLNYVFCNYTGRVGELKFTNI